MSSQWLHQSYRQNVFATRSSPWERGRRLSGGHRAANGENPNTGSTVAASSCRGRPNRAPAVSRRMTFIHSTDPQTSEQPVPSSPLHLIGQEAKSAEDKYRLLQQRDKILRQAMPKQRNLDLSKVFVGTCPDMCPEKERYMREAFHLHSSLELVPNTKMFDHTAAIKEYRRSSADQEEPLPHELRPLAVLSMTMDYLVTQIMDRCHNDWDWYNFVWNRTRAVRKDIIQQCLCCPQTAALIEKCMRFHIHCAHHFCEEHVMSFDTKMNDENMRNCLQSLREMYQDLAAQQVYCPHEAEFRQYGLLLRLNNSDIHSEVQQFRDEVRNSTEVKFALEVFAALHNKRFECFFELVKEASYLASCLLHRYFEQVRAKALMTLNMTRTASSPQPTTVPLEDMMHMLMFHSATEAAGFIQQYGLSVNNGLVTLSRTAFKRPRLPFSPKTSEAIMEKKTMLIGEVVNGGALPNPPQHTPVCSFDSQDKYRGASAAKPEVEALPEVESQPQMKQAKLLAEPRLLRQPQASPEPAKVAAADETGESSESSGRSSLPAKRRKLFWPIIKPLSTPPKPVSNHEVQVDSVMHKVVQAAVTKVASKGANYAATTLWPVRRHELVAVRRQLRRQKKGLHSASSRVIPCLKLRARAPSAPATASMADLARGLVNLDNTSTRSPFFSRWLKKRCKAIYRYQQLLDESVFVPLDLPALVTEMIPNPPDRSWKAAVLLPSDKESVSSLADEVLSSWLKVKFGHDSKGSEVEEQQPDGTLQTLHIANTLQENGQNTQKVHINIKVSRGPLTDEVEERRELQGTRALIMLLHALPTPTEQDKPLVSASLHLQQVLQASTSHCPLPLVILVPGPDGGTRNTQRIQEALMLEKLVTEGFIFQYVFLSLPESMTDMQGSAELIQAMRWLLGRIPPQIPLSCQAVEQRVQQVSASAVKPEVEALPEVESQPQMEQAKLLAEPRLLRQPQASPEPVKAAAADETGESSECPGRSVLPFESQNLFQPIIEAPSTPPKPVSNHEHTVVQTKAANYPATTLWPVRRHELVAVRRQLRQKTDFPAASFRVIPCFRLKARAPSAPAKPSMADVARSLVNLDNTSTRSPSSAVMKKTVKSMCEKERSLQLKLKVAMACRQKSGQKKSRSRSRERRGSPRWRLVSRTSRSRSRSPLRRPTLSSQPWKAEADPDVSPAPKRFTTCRPPGVQLETTATCSPLSLFFSKDTVKTLCKNTNTQAAKSLAKRKKYKWTDVTVEEFHKILGLILFIAMVPLKHINDYLRKNIFFVSFPGTVMSRDRFTTISSNIHLSNPKEDVTNDKKRGTAGYDILFRVKPLLDEIRTACKAASHPDKNLAIDERIVATKAKIGITQCRKRTPTKALKLFVLTDPENGYTVDFSVYAGKSRTNTENGHAYDIVLHTSLGTLEPVGHAGKTEESIPGKAKQSDQLIPVRSNQVDQRRSASLCQMDRHAGGGGVLHHSSRQSSNHVRAKRPPMAAGCVSDAGRRTRRLSAHRGSVRNAMCHSVPFYTGIVSRNGNGKS